jgi:hypothetical protein
MKMQRRFICCLLGLFSIALSATSARATLTFYYDPLTGNVSFDTSETSTGGIISYWLRIGPTGAPFEFREENHIRVTYTTFASSSPHNIGEITLGAPVKGLFTIGDILPIGLSEQAWAMFSPFLNDTPNPGKAAHTYLDRVGGGVWPPAANFVYGRPDREFDNWTKLLDPDELTWAQRAKLMYVPATGEVMFDTGDADGGYSIGVYLKSNGAFLAGGFSPSFDPGVVATANSTTIMSVVDLLEPGRYSLGNILPAGLSGAEFEAAFTTAKFYGRAGFGSTSFDFLTGGESLDLVVVPEPTASFGLALGALFAWSKRRGWPRRRGRR